MVVIPPNNATVSFKWPDTHVPTGVEVAPYECICPYHYNGQKPENKDEKENKNKEKDFSLNGTVSANNATNEDDVIKLKKNLYKMNYYKPNERSEPDGQFHKYANTELITAIKDFQRDNNLPTRNGAYIIG